MGCCGIFMFLLINILAAVAQLAVSITLADWTGKPYSEQQRSIYPTLFIGSVVIFMILVLFRVIIVFAIFLSSTTNMHNEMTKKVLRASVLFFDSNPIGRITTRFSKDVVVLDLMVPPITVFVVMGAFRVVFITITICTFNPWLLIALLAALIFIIAVQRKGTPPTIDSQRMDNIMRGPVNSVLQMQVAGLVTLRAYDRLKFFK